MGNQLLARIVPLQGCHAPAASLVVVALKVGQVWEAEAWQGDDLSAGPYMVTKIDKSGVVHRQLLRCTKGMAGDPPGGVLLTVAKGQAWRQWQFEVFGVADIRRYIVGDNRLRQRVQDWLG